LHSQKGNICLVVWLVVAALLRLIAVALGVGRPEGQVVPQQLHDECRVLVGVLVECVQLGYRIIERLVRLPIKKGFILVLIHKGFMSKEMFGKANASW